MSERIEDMRRRVRMAYHPDRYVRHRKASGSLNGGAIVDLWCRECGRSIEDLHAPGCANEDMFGAAVTDTVEGE